MYKLAFYSGLAFILLAFGAAVVSIYFLLFAIPVYLTGAILVSFSRIPLKGWLLACLLPVLLYYPSHAAFLYAWNAWNRNPVVTFLFVDGFRGPVAFVYGEPCGEPPGKEGGRTLYRVPASGVLILQEAAPGVVNDEYFYERRDGTREKLAVISHPDQLQPGAVAVCLSGSGTLSERNTKRIIYHSLAVLGKGPINDWDLEEMESVVRAVVRRCRAEVAE